jgi:hypothetical protein
MNYSRKQLYALGEPFGESATRLKPGGRVYGGGGSSSTPEKTTQVTDLPDWAKGYAKDTLAKGAALSDISQNPYQQYGGQRIAGFQPMQQQAFEGAAGMQPSQQVGLGSGIAGMAGLGALNTNYQGRNFQGGQFNSQAAEDYMNPYTQSVVDYQKSQALRDFQIAQPMRQAQAVQQGAFGGSRSAIVDAEAQRSLNSQLQGITATGQQAAFQNAQQQFNADQARRLQAQQMGEQSRQYGAGLGMQGLQTGLQAAGQLGQLGQTEYGQKMGINQLQSAYGQQQQQQAQRPLDMAYQDFINQQNYPYKQLGFMSDMIRGLPLGQQSTSQVYQGSGNTMGQLAGLGMGAYGLSQMIGSPAPRQAEGGLTGYAGGGEVKTYAGDYGSVTSDDTVKNILTDLSDLQLQQAKEAALNERNAEQAQMIDAEMARRANMRSNVPPQQFAGIAPALPEQFADGMEQSMATGGIVAFAGDDSSFVIDPMLGTTQSTAVSDDDRTLFERMGLSNRENRRVLENAEKKMRERAESEKKPKTKPASAADVEDMKARNALIMSGQDVTKEGNVLPQQVAPAKPATKLEGIAAGPKPSKSEVKSAVAQFAEQNNIGTEQKEDLMTTALRIREELGKQNQPILDKLNAAIESQKPNEQALRERGFNQGIAQFGFGLAERAARPGARFLESASGAAPVLASVAEKTNALIETQKQNYTNLKLDQAKYEVALAKGDMQTAATLAGQIRQQQQQDQMLKFQIEKARQEFVLKQEELGLKREELQNTRNYQGQIASRYETVGSLTRDIMKNEGLSYGQAFAKASNALKGGIGADIRADASRSVQLQKDIDKIDETFYPIIMATKDPAKLAALNAKRDSLVQKKIQEASMGGASTSGSPPPSLAQKGFKLLGTE